MARYLLDTNIFTFIATKQYDCLTRDVAAIMNDYDNEFWMPLISSDRKFPFYRSQGLDLIYNGKEN